MLTLALLLLNVCGAAAHSPMRHSFSVQADGSVAEIPAKEQTNEPTGSVAEITAKEQTKGPTGSDAEITTEEQSDDPAGPEAVPTTESTQTGAMRRVEQREVQKSLAEDSKDSNDNSSALLATDSDGYPRCACENPGHQSFTSCERDRTCACNGKVRLGYGHKWSAWKDVTGSIQCSNSAFGGDPWLNQAKECQCQAPITTVWKTTNGRCVQSTNGDLSSTPVETCSSTTGCWMGPNADPPDTDEKSSISDLMDACATSNGKMGNAYTCVAVRIKENGAKCDGCTGLQTFGSWYPKAYWAGTTHKIVSDSHCEAAPAEAPKVMNYCVVMQPGSWKSEVRWSLDGGDEHHYSEEKTVQISGGQHTLTMIDTYGDGWNGAKWSLRSSCDSPSDLAGPFTFLNGKEDKVSFSEGRVSAQWTNKQWCGGENNGMNRVASLSGNGIIDKQEMCAATCVAKLNGQSGCCQVDTGTDGCFMRTSFTPQTFWSTTAWATSITR